MVALVRASGGTPRAAVGVGESVHEALRSLANELVARGIWIEVTARREWRLVEPPATILPHADFGDSDCCGLLRGIIREGALIDPARREHTLDNISKGATNELHRAGLALHWA